MIFDSRRLPELSRRPGRPFFHCLCFFNFLLKSIISDSRRLPELSRRPGRPVFSCFLFNFLFKIDDFCNSRRLPELSRLSGTIAGYRGTIAELSRGPASKLASRPLARTRLLACLKVDFVCARSHELDFWPASKLTSRVPARTNSTSRASARTKSTLAYLQVDFGCARSHELDLGWISLRPAWAENQHEPKTSRISVNMDIV
jgi:hypothetical protein